MRRRLVTLLCLGLGWMVSCAVVAAEWSVERGSLVRRDAGTETPLFRLEDANALSMRSDGGTWIAAGGDLLSIAEDGRMQVRIGLASLGVGTALHIAADAYDGSVWVATDRSLLLHFAGDGRLVFGTTVRAPASALTIDLAQDAWVVTGDVLLHVEHDGRPAETRSLGLDHDEVTHVLVVDAFRERIWLATHEGLYYMPTRDARAPLTRALRGDTTDLALDQRSGRMLAVVEETLIALEGIEVHSWLKEPPESGERAVSALYDAADDAFVIETRDAMLRVATDGRTLDRAGGVERSLRAGTPLRIDPALALLRPPSGGAVTDPFVEILLRVGVTCNGKPCDVPADYLARTHVEAEIDGFSLGGATIGASGRATFPTRPTMHTGGHRLSAKLTDMFGHTVALDPAQWTVLTRTAATQASDETVARDGDRGPKAANKVPTVSLTAPSNGAVFVAGSDIALTATAADSDGSITRVEFYRGTTLVGTATTAPYQVSWARAAAGTYSLTAKAYDDRKASATSSAVSVVVVDNQPPTVMLTTPQPGSFAAAGSTLIVSATASDSDGTIANVEFHDGTTPIGFVSRAPYQIAWTPTTAGVHALSANATDDRGGVARSPVVDLLVGAPPVVVMTTPAACSTMDGPLDVVLAADAASTSGKIAGVEFFDNGSSVGTADTAPWRAVLIRAPIGEHSITARATDEHGLVTVSRPSTFTVRGPNQPPNVALTAPADGARFTFGSAVSLQASATDTDGTVSAVEFRLDGSAGALIARATQSPYAATWTNAAAGSYAVVAVAYDDRNASTVSAPLHITVDPNARPTVTLTVPRANARLVAGNNVTVAANASDGDGTVSRVDFYAGPALIGSSASPPYSAIWTPAAAGAYSLTAKAIDNAGGISTSDAVPVTVVTNALPTIALTATSPDGDLYAPATIVLSAVAQDSDGSIAGVDFYAGATLIAHSSAAPYRFVWDSVQAGTYPLTAKAIDDLGGETSSSPVNVTIAAGPSINIDPALSDATIDDDNVLIRGFVSAPANAALTVNGAVTHIDDLGGFSANEVPLAAGPNTVTVQVTAQNGQSTTQSIIVNSNGAGPFVVHASPTEGLETLQVTFTIENPAHTPFKQMYLDLDNDGYPNLLLTPGQFTDGKLTITSTYPVGTWLAVLKAYDDQDRVIYSTSRSIVVRMPQLLQSRLLAIYDGMLTRLRAGNIVGALTAFTGSAYDKYNEIFTELQPALAEVVDQLGEVNEITFNEDVAELTVAQQTTEGPRLFMIYLIRSEDGIWRIEGM